MLPPKNIGKFWYLLYNTKVIYGKRIHINRQKKFVNRNKREEDSQQSKQLPGQGGCFLCAHECGEEACSVSCPHPARVGEENLPYSVCKVSGNIRKSAPGYKIGFLMTYFPDLSYGGTSAGYMMFTW